MKINDGLQSLATSMGQRSAQREFVRRRPLSDKKLLDLYEQNWIVRKLIDNTAMDMTRLDRDILDSWTPEQDKSYEGIAKRLGVFQCRKEVLAWGSLLGDSMLVAITTYEQGDTPDNYLETMLDLSKEKIVRFIVLDKTCYRKEGELEDDITQPNFGKPRLYQVTVGGTQIKIHNSRVRRLEAGQVTIKERASQANQYGRSDIEAIRESLFNYMAATTSIFDIIDHSKRDVLSIEGFNAGVKAGNEGLYHDIALAMKTIASSTDITLLDATATWEQKEMTFTGLTDIWAKARDDLAGACNRPLTWLFGQSASGFASGEEDNKRLNETIASLQESRLRPIDEFIDMFILDLMGEDRSFLNFKYPSIEIMNDEKISTILNTTTTALSTALQDGVITEVAYATELKNKGLVSSITDEDIAELKELTSGAAQIESSETEQAIRSLLSPTNADLDQGNGKDSP